MKIMISVPAGGRGVDEDTPATETKVVEWDPSQPYPDNFIKVVEDEGEVEGLPVATVEEAVIATEPEAVVEDE